MTNACCFDDFGDLYRAAYAEVDPETKQILLAEVKNVLDRWQETVRDEAVTAPETRIPYLSSIRRAA